ncbi:hypothetical protein BDN72DRAFT_962816 [Pluteus cervinus]|uniref:Uncharacterized protein n=1 Tax=Pluteus cervinus TaxID=181527 RepID=A0ACD3AHC5_9AGAR|nr:hypothetical protein BDN72DRAFT_962816 [Pluteus cervinus]
MAFNLTDPTFPPEIEHVIFTSAVEHQDLRPFPINLILVAKRVHQWLIPILYRTISLHADQEYPILWGPETLEKHGKYARNLFLWTPSSEFDGISPDLPLSLCPNVTNLFWWAPTHKAEVKAISQLPLTCLSVELNNIEQTPDIIKTFSRITHLDNIGIFTDNIITLDHFTSLTHLSAQEDEPAQISLLFDRVPKLQVLICYRCERSLTRPVVEDFDPDNDDPRLVRMAYGVGACFEDWFADIIYSRGIWGLAEAAIETRKKEREPKGSLN